MKVYMRSYKIQTVLIIMGSIMCTASTLESSVRWQERLFAIGLICLVMGIASWGAVQIDKARRTAELKRRRETMKQQKAQTPAQTVRGPVRRGY